MPSTMTRFLSPVLMVRCRPNPRMRHLPGTEHVSRRLFLMMAGMASALGRMSQEPAHSTKWPRAVGRYVAKSSQDANIWHDEEAGDDEDVSPSDDSRRVEGAGRVAHRSTVEIGGRSPADAEVRLPVVLRTTNAAVAATAQFPSRGDVPHAVFCRVVRRIFVLDSSGFGSIMPSQLACRQAYGASLDESRCAWLLGRVGTKR